MRVRKTNMDLGLIIHALSAIKIKWNKIHSFLPLGYLLHIISVICTTNTVVKLESVFIFQRQIN